MRVTGVLVKDIVGGGWLRRGGCCLGGIRMGELELVRIYRMLRGGAGIDWA